MLLTDIRDYISKNKIADINELSAAVRTDKETVKGALDFWIAKGKVAKEEKKKGFCSGCGSCGSCGEIYKWVN